MYSQLSRVVAIALMATPVVLAGAADTNSNLVRLKSDKMEVRQKAASDIRESYKETVRELIKMGAQKVTPLPSERPADVEYAWSDSKHLAVQLLGDLRAPDAVPMLLDNLDYRNPKRLSGSYLYEEGMFPSVESLIKIGMPAVGPVIEKLSAYAQDCLGRRLCLVVLKEILGPRLAKVRLEMAVEEAKDDAARANLRAALEQLEPEPQPAEPPGR